MADRSKIEWTDATWNPVRGCTRVSRGCGGPGKAGGCYAEKIAARFSAPGQPFHGFAERVGGEARWTGKLALIEDKLLEPLSWKKPRRIFVNSMSDLFHEKLPDEAIDKVFSVMALCPQHTFQILTKRPERMREYFADPMIVTRIAAQAHIKVCSFGDPTKFTPAQAAGVFSIQYTLVEGTRTQLPTSLARWPLPNVWLGTSCEDQATADERIPLLLQTPAAIRFVSCEPLLGPIDLTEIVTREPGSESMINALHCDIDPADDELLKGATLDWIIVGGESGKGARPMHPDWARSLRDQCDAAGVSFFFKQWGAWTPDTGPLVDGDPIFEGKGPCAKLGQHGWEFSENGFTMPLGGDGEWVYRLGKKRAGRLLDAREHNEFPEART